MKAATGHRLTKHWMQANKSNTPLFVECHLPQYSLEDQLQKMRPGDIITHSYEQISETNASC